MYGRPSKRMRRIKPVARVGAVDINVRYDILAHQRSGKGRSDEFDDVLEGEVLFKLDSGNFYRDNSLHVLSCLNLMPENKQEAADAQPFNGDRKPPQWIVAGVAVTGFSPRTDVYEQGFVLQVSGLTSVFNNSGKLINAGDNVYVTASDSAPTPTGIPHNKKLLQLVTDTGVEGKKLVDSGDAQFLGTCAKGGPSKSTIDIVLHQCGPANVPPAPVKNLNAAARFTRPAASVPKPKAKKSKSSK